MDGAPSFVAPDAFTSMRAPPTMPFKPAPPPQQADHATIEADRRGVAQSGSASALGAEGRGFESLRPDHSSTHWN